MRSFASEIRRPMEPVWTVAVSGRVSWYSVVVHLFPIHAYWRWRCMYVPVVCTCARVKLVLLSTRWVQVTDRCPWRSSNCLSTSSMRLVIDIQTASALLFVLLLFTHSISICRPEPCVGEFPKGEIHVGPSVWERETVMAPCVIQIDYYYYYYYMHRALPKARLIWGPPSEPQQGKPIMYRSAFVSSVWCQRLSWKENGALTEGLPMSTPSYEHVP